MCGIAGILNLDSLPAPEEHVLRGMLGMIRHRGPDEFGIYLHDQAALGNARLSIIDLAGGQQPISNEDETLWIVFNGEIFNYVELKAGLLARGHRFRTDTDTEVLVHLYEEEGVDCLRRLNGQFAVAVWDEGKRRLLLARDRLGVRPLYYTKVGATLVFASEIKSILAVPGARAEIDPVALNQVFVYWSTLSPRTIFRGIREVPPGQFLVAQDGKVELRSYWQLVFPTAQEAASLSRSWDSDGGLEGAADQLHELLWDAARIRLRADVPVGAYLSGGLDSSTIAAMIRALGVSRLDTFSIAFSDPQYDESPYQRRMAEFLGTNHQVVYATHADIGKVFPEVTWHTEMPVMRTAPAPMFLLSRLVRDRGYKVVLTGEGADEFLGGYDIFKEMKVRRFWATNPASRWRPALLSRLYPDIRDLQTTGGAFLRAFFASGLQETQAPDYSHAIRWRNNRRNCRFFSQDLMEEIDGGGEVGEAEIAYPERFDAWGALAKAQYLEISIFLSHYLLSSQGDRVAMAHSVEGRYPFLDLRVVGFCNNLPPQFKLRGLSEKVLLRQVARRYLPEEIWLRHKRPYRAPIRRSFLSGIVEPYVEELLSAEVVRGAGYFKADAVRRLMAKLGGAELASETDEMALVGILSTQLVHHQFVSGFRPRTALSREDNVKVIRRINPGGRSPVCSVAMALSTHLSV